MKKAFLTFILVLTLLQVVHGRELVDQLGRKVEVAEPLTRVVSLIPSLTETSYEVGGGAALVGATRFATYPEQAKSLGATIDWANTMVLPVPSNAVTEIEEVTLANGGKGLIFSNPGADEDEAAIMWTHSGMSYLIRGGYETDTVKALAGSVE